MPNLCDQMNWASALDRCEAGEIGPSAGSDGQVRIAAVCNEMSVDATVNSRLFGAVRQIYNKRCDCVRCSTESECMQGTTFRNVSELLQDLQLHSTRHELLDLQASNFRDTLGVSARLLRSAILDWLWHNIVTATRRLGIRSALISSKPTHTLLVDSPHRDSSRFLKIATPQPSRT